jgi:hypothetical protein
MEAEIISLNATNAKCNEAFSEFDIETAPPIPVEVYQNLPKRLKNLCSLIDDQTRKDVFLISCLPVISSQMPNVLAYHRDKWYAPDILAQIVAGPGQGKGMASKGLQMGLVTDDEIRSKARAEIKRYSMLPDKEKVTIPPPQMKSLIIPANASSRKMLDRIQANGGNGLIFENEIDTLINATKQEWGNYTDTVRKSFHHEPLSIIRTNGEYYIQNPRLSILLTGTFDQFKKMFESAENGHFSRYALYTFKRPMEWRSHKPNKRSYSLYQSVRDSGQAMYDMYKRLSGRDNPLFISLTDDQWQHIDDTFSQKMEVIQELGLSDYLHASNNRMPIIALRLTSLFTVLRLNDSRPEDIEELNEVTPTREDFTAGLYLANTLTEHAVRLFYVLPESDSNPKGKRFEEFCSVLPTKFETADALLAGEELNIPERTIKYWLSKDESFTRIKRGEYKKMQ